MEGGPKTLGLGSFANLFLRSSWKEEKWLAREAQNSFIYEGRHQHGALIGRGPWGLCGQRGAPSQSARENLRFHARSSPYPHNVSLSLILRFRPKFWTKIFTENSTRYSPSWGLNDLKNTKTGIIYFQICSEIPNFVKSPQLPTISQPTI